MGIGVGVGVLAWMLKQKEEQEETPDNLLNQMNDKIEHLEARTQDLEQKN